MRLSAILAAACLAASARAAAEAPLTLHYQERPPYSSAAGSDEVRGLVATPAGWAVQGARIPFRWVQTPARRQLVLIQGGSGRHCGIGWFRTAEREARGRFSRPLYRDLPFAALVRAELPIASGVRSAELVADARYPVLVKEGFSYGPQLDAMLARAATPVRTSAEVTGMPDMLRAKRAAWMPVSGEEASLLVGPGLRRIDFSDLPPGQTRHLYCSSDVPDEWLDRIDRALAAPR
jgi:polar amino acid transport system substrate-binding protein